MKSSHCFILLCTIFSSCILKFSNSYNSYIVLSIGIKKGSFLAKYLVQKKIRFSWKDLLLCTQGGTVRGETGRRDVKGVPLRDIHLVNLTTPTSDSNF